MANGFNQFDADKFNSQMNQILMNGAPDLQTYISSILNQSVGAFMSSAFAQAPNQPAQPSVQQSSQPAPQFFAPIDLQGILVQLLQSMLVPRKP